LHLHAASLATVEPRALTELVRKCAVPHVERHGNHGHVLDFARWAAPVLAGDDIGHGEALSLAIALDAVRSAIHGLLGVDELDSILSTMDLLALPTFHPLLDREETRRALGERMIASEATTSTLLASAGSTSRIDIVDPGGVTQAIAWLGQRANGLRR
jgi:hypothetical protein